jgi:rhamnosyltransferase subunit B
VARVLIGWELGAGRGHVARLIPVISSIVDAGHDVALAPQRIDTLGPMRDARVTLFQAPLWPGLLASVGVRPAANVSTLIDILCRLGLGDAGTLAALISGWDTLLAAWQPDIVIAEFAPALLCAARGRVRSVGIGSGFVQPPAHLDALPRLAGDPGYDEGSVLDTIDADLRSIGREPLSALPALFGADDALIETFVELDPYAAHRVGGWCAPTDGFVMPAERGDEIFVYAHAATMADSPLWTALAAVGKPVRIYCPDASPDFAAMLRGQRMIVERRPVAWPDIARRSRLVVSHGGHGFACAALVAGVPHLVTPYDLEKQLTADALVCAGLGRAVGLAAVEPHIIRDVYDDDGLAVRAHVAAPGFAARTTPSFATRLGALIPE